MPTATHISIETMREVLAKQTPPTKRRSDPAQWVVEVGSSFPPLELVNKPNLTTAEAAFYLNRAPQTLRAWACLENFPAGLRCRRIGGLLAWPTVEVKALAGVPA